MAYITVKTKDIKPIIQATFPNYRKREVIIEVTEKVTFHNLNWSGGTRSEYRACDIAGNSIGNKVNINKPSPWNNPYEGKEISLPEHAVIVEAGFFCGKEVKAMVYIHPANMPKLLPNNL
jgi:hypothetical protein